MALNTKVSTTLVNAQADILGSLLDGGYLRIYDGAQPDDGDTALSGQKLLAELRFDSPAFFASEAGELKAKPLVADEDAAATGKASWFRCFASDGTTPILDGSIGIANCNMNMKALQIQQHARVSLDGFTHTLTS